MVAGESGMSTMTVHQIQQEGIEILLEKLGPEDI
jgi:hypothetical protein